MSTDAPGATTTQRINIEDEMRQSYMDYAMSVIIGRALPDVRDGLKPVQRRVLYAMLKEGLVSNKKHSKCAGVVGEVLKRYHPHGDISVYDALVRLAQPWSLRYPLVDGQGNFGSVDGDPPAAYRYTECRMTALAERLLEDIEKETVDFIPNFDDSTMEPTVLPSVVPNLLINGADGIAVGMATHIPPHNQREVVSGTIALLDNPSISLAELMTHIPGPDFPTGAVIHGRGPILSAYRDGRGVVQVRAKMAVETLSGKSREVQAIVVTEIPFQLNKARLVERIADLVNEKLIEGISKLRDESDRSGMRIVMELKRDASPEVVMNQLYKLTPLQSSFGIINLAIVEGQPVVCSLPDLLTHFIHHRRDVVTRRTQYELRKASARMHILEGFRIVLLNLDAVIKLIRGSETPEDAKAGLQSSYKLSDIQAQAILDMRLQKLTGLERLAVEQEHAELALEIDRLRGILADTKKVDAIIRAELVVIRDSSEDKRRTEIIDGEADIDMEDLIVDEEVVVTVSHKGYVKRTPVSEYRAQKRGGKGVAGASASDDDFIEQIFVTTARSNLLIFNDKGRAFSLKVYEIPQASRTARGRALVNIIKLEPDERLRAVLSFREYSDSQFVLTFTRQGQVKKTALTEYSFARQKGVIGISIKDGDALVGAALVADGDHVILAKKSGMAVRFSADQVRPMARQTAGVRGAKVDEGDEIVGMAIAPKAIVEGSGELSIFTVCENGYGKRSLITEYPSHNRGGQGVIDIQTDERNGSVVGMVTIENEGDIILITSVGQVIRFSTRDLKLIGRNTKGVRLVNLNEGETVADVTLRVGDGTDTDIDEE